MTRFERSVYRDVGARLRAARDAAGLSQAAVGDELGVTRAAVSLMEQGRIAIMLSHVVKISRVYGISPRLLVPEQ